MGQIATAKRVFASRGWPGVLSAFKDRYLNNSVGARLDWCYGRMLELRGNVVRVERCVFSLDSPAITTASKSKFMFDQYERPEREAIRRFVDPALPVVELGGSIGVVACLTNRLLRDPRAHVVVEANPALVPLLLSNRDRNGCHFTVLARMVGYGAARSSFYVDRNNFVVSSARPTGGGSSVAVVEVETVDLSSILDEHGFDRCTLICDIEGGESELLRYEADVLRRRVSTMILEVHEWAMGAARTAQCFEQLGTLGFRTVFAEADTHVLQRPE